MTNARSLHTLLDQTTWIHALARRLVADPSLAADLAQETCVEALVRRPAEDRPLRAWLATVMRRNLAHLRRGDSSRAAREQGVAREEREASALDVIERAETHRNVVLAVLALSEPTRSTLLMRFFEQLSYEEIARRTGVTSAAVNSRVTRGLAELRARLESTYGGDRRALGLALVPLAQLPTGLALTTATGWKTMTFWIGSAAAGVIVTTFAVANLGNGARGTGTSAPTPAGAPTATEELALALPLVADGAAERVEPALRLSLAQEPQGKAPPALWETRLAHSLVLAPSVLAFEFGSGAGNVEVRPSASGRLEIEAHVVARLEQVEARRLTQVFADHVEVSETKGVLRIVDDHEGEKGWSVHLVVFVPKALPLSASSGAGDVHVLVAATKVKANSGAGEVRVELPDGRLESLHANSGAGDVAVAVGSVAERVTLNSGAGAVTLLLREPLSAGNGELTSGAGEVRLIVPANFVGALDLESMGSIVVPPSFGLAVEQDFVGNSTLRGTLGVGGGSYRLRSGAGTLAVEIGHALPAKATRTR